MADEDGEESPRIILSMRKRLEKEGESNSERDTREQVGSERVTPRISFFFPTTQISISCHASWSLSVVGYCSSTAKDLPCSERRVLYMRLVVASRKSDAF